jgi:hypothetical protein
MIYRKQIRFALNTAIVIVCIIPCALFLWNFALPPLQFETSLRFYPSTQEISRASTFLDTNTGFGVRYYWVKDSEETVKAYYETFTEPFVENETVFYLYPQPSENHDFQNRSCYYQKFTCVEIRVIGFRDENVTLPDLISERGYGAYDSPSPLASPIKGGTLIIYSFYTDEW